MNALKCPNDREIAEQLEAYRVRLVAGRENMNPEAIVPRIVGIGGERLVVALAYHGPGVLRDPVDNADNRDVWFAKFRFDGVDVQGESKPTQFGALETGLRVLVAILRERADAAFHEFEEAEYHKMARGPAPPNAFRLEEIEELGNQLATTAARARATGRPQSVQFYTLNAAAEALAELVDLTRGRPDSARCPHDTDGDGNCPRHPNGCTPGPVVLTEEQLKNGITIIGSGGGSGSGPPGRMTGGNR